MFNERVVDEILNWIENNPESDLIRSRYRESRIFQMAFSAYFQTTDRLYPGKLCPCAAFILCGHRPAPAAAQPDAFIHEIPL